ncbi:BTAD domain-containing putative transcriptional regulator [Dactylosporangium sp. NPDC050688]|uniref:AfsR/SARP family transcriptional regulator n=1 Tax=Dactylosporangium sp. NPDC050688 TaxID=3157217 RepID=UPI00340E31DA
MSSTVPLRDELQCCPIMERGRCKRRGQPVRFVILGSTALHVGGERIPIGAAKQRGLFALLLCHAGEPVAVDTIVEHLWDRGDPEEYRGSLYSLASRIRAVLNRVDLPHALVRTAGAHAYRLEVDQEAVDLHRFRRLVREARASGHEVQRSVDLLEEAVGLWHDEPLADLHGAPSEHLRRQLREELLDAERALAGSQIRAGLHHAALARLEPLLRTNPLDEVLARHWVSALAATGHDDDARAFLAAFRRRFRREMRAEPAIGPPSPARPDRHAGGSSPALAAGPRQLPGDVGDFVGQRALLAELDDLTAHDGVVAVSGMPGVGKTTLVIHWGHHRRDRFPDGQLYLDANAYGDAAPVDAAEALGRFLRALDVPADRVPAGLEQRRDRLNQLLSGRRMLIVLDNVLDSDQARALLSTSATCVTVITSRNRLTGLVVRHGVRAITVAPLPESDCVVLLTRMVGPSRAGAEQPAVQTLARLCGGLPLAVRIIGEHVAARPFVPVGDLVEDLARHLMDSDGDDEASLAVVFKWSYTALAPDLARTFRVLGLHPGQSISTEAAGALLGAPLPKTQRLLDALARTHLISYERVRRSRFHDLVRQFAAGRAREEEPASQRRDAMRRLLDWTVLTAANAAARLEPNAPPVPDLPTPTDVEPQPFATTAEAMAWCEAERDNLAALTRWALDKGFHRHAWQLPSVVYEILDRFERQSDMLELLTNAKVAAERDAHPVGRIGTTSNLASAHFALHAYGRALALFDEALGMALSIDDQDAVTYMLHNVATVNLKLGRVAAATETLGQVVDIARTRADHHTEAAALHRLGDAYRMAGSPDDATVAYLRALELRIGLESLRGQAVTHGALATLHLETARHEDALRHCRLALDLHAHTRDEAALGDLLATTADVERLLGRFDEAERSARGALAVGAGLDDPLLRCRAYAVLADVLQAAGRFRAAAMARMDGLRLTEDLDDPVVGQLRRRLLRT